MDKWKKAVCLIAAVIIFILIQLWFRQIERMAEEENHVYEVARQEREQFDKLVSYCKEHEEIYMELSEQAFSYLDEGLSKDEARIAVEKNATLEQKEILEKHSLCFPRDTNDIINYHVRLGDNALYYGEGDIKIVYIHEHSEEVEENIMSVEYTTTVKINDHLYVCYTAFPYT